MSFVRQAYRLGIELDSDLIEDFARELLLLLKNKKLYDKCVHEGLKLAPRYDWEGIARETESFYKKILEENKYGRT